MEVIKYVVVPLIWASSSLYVICGILSLIIKLISKKDTKKTKKRLLIAFISSIISIMIIGAYDYPSDDMPDTKEETNITEAATENYDTSSTTSKVNEVGTCRENPYVLTAEELASEIQDDIDAAKEKYNGKWVMITGTITDTSDGGIMYGYYLYGQRSTTGYTGLSIMCWCEDGPYSGFVIGDTQTFVGQLREITMINVTEIAECERISE